MVVGVKYFIAVKNILFSNNSLTSLLEKVRFFTTSLSTGTVTSYIKCKYYTTTGYDERNC